MFRHIRYHFNIIHVCMPFGKVRTSWQCLSDYSANCRLSFFSRLLHKDYKKKGLQKVYCHIKKQTLYMVFHCHINMYIYVQLFTVKSSIKRIHKRWNSGGNNWETAKIAKASNVRHTSDAAISNISQSPPPPRPSLWASSIEILLHIYTFTLHIIPDERAVAIWKIAAMMKPRLKPY